jgi:hypothetical protein
MRLNIVLRSPVSARPYADDLFDLPIEGVPYCLGALRLRMLAYWYTSPEDYARGRSLLAELGSGLLMGYGMRLVNSMDRVYTLLAANVAGTEYSVTGDGTDASPFIYSPPLVQAPGAGDFSNPSLRTDAELTRSVLDNLVNGSLSSLAPAEAVPNARLQVIIDLLNAMGTDDGPTFEQVAQVIAILGA